MSLGQLLCTDLFGHPGTKVASKVWKLKQLHSASVTRRDNFARGKWHVTQCGKDAEVAEFGISMFFLHPFSPFPGPRRNCKELSKLTAFVSAI
jgi:hypothetical protein